MQISSYGLIVTLLVIALVSTNRPQPKTMIVVEDNISNTEQRRMNFPFQLLFFSTWIDFGYQRDSDLST